MSNDRSIEIEINGPPQSSIIWLHGLGADANDFVPMVEELRLPNHLAVRFIFPNAPIMPVTINNGYKMRAWFDVLSLTDGSKIDQAGIHAAVQTVTKYVEQEAARGTSTSRIILAGFSQGATIALATALEFQRKLAGVIALSGFLSPAMLSQKGVQSFPIFLAHGINDNVLPYLWGEMTRDFLLSLGLPVEWHPYPMDHQVCAAEIADLHGFIVKVLS